MTIESDRANRNWERRLQEAAASFRYPATPDIHDEVHTRLSVDGGRRPAVGSPARPVVGRRLALATLLALIMLVTLLAVPQVRAAVARFLRVGAITIFVGETQEELERAPAAESGEGSSAEAPAVPVPIPTFTSTATRPPALEAPLTLAEAEAEAGFAIRVPAPATGFGTPDEIYLQRLSDADSQPLVILVWHDPQGLETPGIVLYQIGVPDYGMKVAARESIEETRVNGRRAYWVEGEHLLWVPEGNGEVSERLAGSVLVWTEGPLTFRLEGAPSLAEAVRIAESLVPAVENQGSEFRRPS